MSPSPQLTADLDRLVDGELSADERRRLLETLETTPDGWRDCALAFLESQSLRQQLSELASDFSPKPAVVAVEPARHASISLWLTVAASALLAFGVGSYFSNWRGAIPQAPQPGAIAKQGVPPSVAPPNMQPENDLQRPNDTESLVLWVNDEQGQRHSVRAPLVDAQEFDDQYGLRFQSAVSPHVRQRLEGHGYQLSTRRRYAPLFFWEWPAIGRAC